MMHIGTDTCTHTQTHTHHIFINKDLLVTVLTL